MSEENLQRVSAKPVERLSMTLNVVGDEVFEAWSIRGLGTG
jgi:hypothetical protein